MGLRTIETVKSGLSLIAIATSLVCANSASAQDDTCAVTRVDGEATFECEGEHPSGIAVLQPNRVVVKIDALTEGITPLEGTPGVRVLAGSTNAGLPGVNGFTTQLGSVQVPFVRDAANTHDGAFGGDSPSAALEYGDTAGVLATGDFLTV